MFANEPIYSNTVIRSFEEVGRGRKNHKSYDKFMGAIIKPRSRSNGVELLVLGIYFVEEMRYGNIYRQMLVRVLNLSSNSDDYFTIEDNTLKDRQSGPVPVARLFKILNKQYEVVASG